MKKAIFTVNFGNYDTPYPALYNEGWDKILVTDSLPKNANKWDSIILVPQDQERPDLACRKWKWLSHEMQGLKEYDRVCYHDGNCIIKVELPDRPFRIVHGRRTTVHQEAEALNMQEHRVTVASVNEQMAFYDSMGFPDNQGLYYGAIFCRDHSPVENWFCETIFEELTKRTSRDMLALPFVKWLQEYDFPTLGPSWFRKLVRYNYHKNRNPKVYGNSTPHHTSQEGQEPWPGHKLPYQGTPGQGLDMS